MRAYQRQVAAASHEIAHLRISGVIFAPTSPVYELLPPSATAETGSDIVVAIGTNPVHQAVKLHPPTTVILVSKLQQSDIHPLTFQVMDVNEMPEPYHEVLLEASYQN